MALRDIFVTTSSTSTKEKVLTDVSVEKAIESTKEFSVDILNSIRPESKATIMVLNEKNKTVINPYQDFILSSMQFSEQERSQISEMYKGYDLLFLGQRPIQITFNFELFNFKNKAWRDKWRLMWDKYFRGGVVAKNKWRTVIVVDNLVIEGYFLRYDLHHQSTNTGHVPISVLMITDSDKVKAAQLFGTVNSVSPENDSLLYTFIKALAGGKKETTVANS